MSFLIMHRGGGKLTRQAIPDFLQEWSGVSLLAEAGAHAGEKDFKRNRRKEILRSATVPILIIFILCLAVFSAILQYDLSNVFPAFSLLLFCKFAGMAVSILLLWHEIDKANPLLKQICSFGKQTNCNAVLNAKHAKLFNTISWSEIGFFYFAGGFISLLLAGANAAGVLAGLAWLNLLALPYTIFSVYYQWKIVKQWCLLCLTVQAVLIAEFLVLLSTDQFGLPFSFEVLTLPIFLLPVIAWYLVRPLLIQTQEAKRQKRELLKLKYDNRIFSALLPKQKKITVDPLGLGIIIGNPNATNTIIKVCNPYCGPCAKAHPEIDMLLEKNDDLKVQIVFTATDKEDDITAKPVRHLLAIDEKNRNEIEKKQALDDWYLPAKKNYEVFAEKYPMNGELALQGAKINAMRKWCDEMQITFTPTIFINGYQLPDLYKISDLQYFLSA